MQRVYSVINGGQAVLDTGLNSIENMLYRDGTVVCPGSCDTDPVVPQLQLLNFNSGSTSWGLPVFRSIFTSRCIAPP